MAPDKKQIMKSAQGATKIWTRRWAQAIVLIALLGALGIGWHESREISAGDIPLANLPKQIGAWETVSERISLADNNEYKLLKRTYTNDEGQKLHVTIQATYTRLGSLRDWSLASMAEGWSVEEQSIWKGNRGAHGFLIEARIQRLVKDLHHRVALTWYTSAQSQAPTLQLAELKAWRDRLVGGKKPWASMYLLAETDSHPGAQEATKQLAQQLAPALRQLMSAAEPQ